MPGPEPDAELTFVVLAPPTDEDIQDVSARIVRRLVAIARRHLADYDDDVACLDPERQLVDACAAEAMRRPRGQLFLPISRGLKQPKNTKPLTARLDGFSLHAARRVPAHARDELERLCRHGLRPPFATDRFSRLEDGRVRYELPRPTANGQTDIALQPTALLRRLAALLPQPHFHLTRYHGVFAARSKFRNRLPPPPASTDISGDEAGDESTGPEHRPPARAPAARSRFLARPLLRPRPR